MTFTTELTVRVSSIGPICAGIDPSTELMRQWGLPDDATGLAKFCDICLEAFVDAVPVVKPQVAFFERLGAVGVEVLEGFLAAARRAGLLVIADAKRSDIAHTMHAYAEAWLAPESPLAADAVTAVPYHGLGSLEPMIARARDLGSAVIVVARTSNPEGRTIHEALVQDRTEPASVQDALLADIAERNKTELAQHRDWTIGPLGAVVGATLEPSLFDLGNLQGVILAPGVGAQGAGPKELRRLFAGCPEGTVLPSVSRSVLAAGPEPGALRRAAVSAREEAARALA